MADDSGNGCRRQKLDEHYNLVVTQLLKYQSATIGLFPLHTSGKDKEAHIRDNIYCAISIWGLSLAYRHIDDDQGRTHALEQSTVKCMRGILFCYMRQCNKVEQFKKDQRWRNTLHAKFHCATGDEVVTDNEYNHFQIDIISLFLLTLAQMTVSGLFIIFTTDEVNFIQNLVYYVERTYRTADYGIWERGTRYNDGSRELSASSIGMARAALEAVNGLNLYGAKGTSWSVLYTDPDAHNRNTSILNTLLPRESRSKETDAALLCTLGYPAFAVVDEKLHKETKERLFNTLKGEYGLKRFLRDGYGTSVEPKDRRHYDRSILKNFDGIEAEWPIFYVYLALEAYFLGDQEDAVKYMKKVESLLVTLKQPKTDTDDSTNAKKNKPEEKVLPKYYYVPQEYIQQEKGKPGSVERIPDTDQEVFLWGHSLYLLAKLLVDGLVTTSEIDPLNRHLFEKAAKMKSISVHYRYSLFENSGEDLVIQVCLISENRNLKSSLATYGVVTQTTKEVEPIQICAPSHLVKIYERLGVNKKLALSGRPNRPIGVLGTSKIYRVLGKTVATYPILLDESDFYMSLDMSLLIDGIKTILAFIRKRWNMQGRPTLCIILRDHNFRGSHFKEMLDFMAALKNGNVNGIRVLLGRLQTFVSTACVEHLDFIRTKSDDNPLDIRSEDLFRPSETLQPSIGFKSVYNPDLRGEIDLERDEEDSANYDHKSTEDIVELYQRTTSLRAKVDLLHKLLSRHDYHFKVMGRSILDEIDEIYRQASYLKLWSVVRYSAALLGKVVDSLAPAITTMLVSGRQVTIGIFGQNEHIISEPMTPASIQSVIYSTCKPHNAREAVLQQEMLIYLSDLLSTKPELFTGMLRLRVGWIIQAIKNQLSLCTEDEWGQKPGSIYSLPPSAIKQLLKSLLNKKGNVLFWDVTPRSWLQMRQLEGALNRVPSHFYSSVWTILECVPGGLRLGSHYLPQQPTLSEMTANEVDFSLRVEEMLSTIKHPEFRQSIVELLTVIATILERNPELEVRQCIDLDEIHSEAVRLFKNDPTSEEASESAFYNLGQAENSGTMAYYARAIVNKLLEKSVSFRPENACSIS
ncbi:phosphorylase b kinase regulatory subunit beta-like isoform X1 [Rhopilema esculentum]|uniref:phosphorylase b kinase regulatory subunit beta-like isoform X1 n=2 Tax=Rhopilema esculentum TaxID=499914 RepID=UPI0031E196B1